MTSSCYYRFGSWAVSGTILLTCAGCRPTVIDIGVGMGVVGLVVIGAFIVWNQYKNKSRKQSGQSAMSAGPADQHELFRRANPSDISRTTQQPGAHSEMNYNAGFEQSPAPQGLPRQAEVYVAPPAPVSAQQPETRQEDGADLGFDRAATPQNVPSQDEPYVPPAAQMTAQQPAAGQEDQYEVRVTAAMPQPVASQGEPYAARPAPVAAQPPVACQAAVPPRMQLAVGFDSTRTEVAEMTKRLDKIEQWNLDNWQQLDKRVTFLEDAINKWGLHIKKYLPPALEKIQALEESRDAWAAEVVGELQERQHEMMEPPLRAIQGQSEKMATDVKLLDKRISGLQETLAQHAEKIETLGNAQFSHAQKNLTAFIERCDESVREVEALLDKPLCNLIKVVRAARANDKVGTLAAGAAELMQEIQDERKTPVSGKYWDMLQLIDGITASISQLKNSTGATTPEDQAASEADIKRRIAVVKGKLEPLRTISRQKDVIAAEVATLRRRFLKEVSIAYISLMAAHEPGVKEFFRELLRPIRLDIVDVEIGKTIPDVQLHEVVSSALVAGHPPGVVVNVVGMGLIDQEASSVTRAQVIISK
jgi:hypothetical protein